MEFTAGDIFTNDNKERHPDIVIMHVCENFVLFRKGDWKPSVESFEEFTEQYIERYGYYRTLYNFTYKGVDCNWDEDVFVICSPINTTTKTEIGAKAIIDYWQKNHLTPAEIEQLCKE